MRALKKKVLVIGTGTIGEPLIGLLTDFSKLLGIEQVLFHKRRPLLYERSKVNSLLKRGAALIVDEDKIAEFEKLGHKVRGTISNALDAATVVIDCTPAGNENKKLFYEELAPDSDKIFVAQGSEKGFGIPYAHGLNDSVLEQDRSFLQVVSCNTHNISSILKTLDPSFRTTVESDFVCIRRANDISQSDGFIPSPEAGLHNDAETGTHHARDAIDLLQTVCDRELPVFSSAMKLNTQYMHAIRFRVKLLGDHSLEDIKTRFRENIFFSTTKKRDATRVFSFGRDHGYYGRIFNHGVLVEDSLHVKREWVMPHTRHTAVTGFCFTPQDGNSLLSSVAVVAFKLLSPPKRTKTMEKLYEYLFEEI